MNESALAANQVLSCPMMARTQSLSQAGKQLDERAKKVAMPRQDNWKQVDEINKEADKTKSRYQQAQQTGTHGQKSTYTVKKSPAGSGNTYKKPSPSKQKTSPKKK